jgi:hypothetical protein
MLLGPRAPLGLKFRPEMPRKHRISLESLSNDAKLMRIEPNWPICDKKNRNVSPNLAALFRVVLPWLPGTLFDHNFAALNRERHGSGDPR